MPTYYNLLKNPALLLLESLFLIFVEDLELIIVKVSWILLYMFSSKLQLYITYDFFCLNKKKKNKKITEKIKINKNCRKKSQKYDQILVRDIAKCAATKY